MTSVIDPPKVNKSTLTTIYATGFGARGDYTGTQNTAGTGTDARAAIQAALNAAYTQGPGGVNDTINGASYRVVIPKGKYYISAPADGSPSLVVPLKVELDFSEAELHFDRPPIDTVNTFGHGISEPNPLWCAIKLGQMSGLKIGKMQIVAGRDLTYGGTWYGLNMDAIRVQEADISWIEGAGREHYILGFTRGAAIRCIACYNTFVEKINVSSCAFGVIQSYFGTAFSGYTRYRGTTGQESVCTSIYIDKCSFLNIFKKGVYCGVNGDYHTPASGGFEVVSFDRTANGGPVSIHQTSFERIAEEAINVTSSNVLLIDDIRIELTGCVNTLGTIYASSVGSFKLNGCVWIMSGGTVLAASYTGPLATITPNPDTFVRVDATDISPLLQNVYVFNNANNSCRWVNGGTATRLPTLINCKAAASTMMQGTSTYMATPPPTDGGRIWSISTVGLAPQESVNGSRTAFTFVNGFTPQLPQRILVDGQILEATDAAGTNWTWNSSTGVATFTVAPAKKVRAFY